MATMKGQIVTVTFGERARMYLVMGKITTKGGVVVLHDAYDYDEKQARHTKVIVLHGVVELADME